MKRFTAVVLGGVVLAGAVAVGWRYEAIDSVVENNKSSFNLLKQVDFKSCNDSGYYPGYGPESLNTDILDDYLASNTAKDSSLCFEVDQPSIISSLKLVWFSKAEAPKFIEVLGVSDDGEETILDVLWPKDRLVEVKPLDEFFYSEFKFDSGKSYSGFRVNYVSGSNQDRLLLRSAAPFFKTAVDSKFYDALSDTFRISKTAPYGAGAVEVRAKTPEALVTEFKSMDSLHCGNFSYLFAYEADDDVKWTAIGAFSKAKAAHTVVEVREQDKTYTVDPTLGALYPCAYSDMQAGKCDFDKALYTETFNPILWQYSGENFYPGAEVQIRHTEIESYYNDYKKL